MGFLDRVIAGLSRAGEDFTVGSNTYRGVFRVLDTGTMRNYLDDVEVMAVTRPGLLLITQGDAEIDVSDTITRDGRTYTVLKTSQHRVGRVTVVKQAVLA